MDCLRTKNLAEPEIVQFKRTTYVYRYLIILFYVIIFWFVEIFYLFRHLTNWKCLTTLKALLCFREYFFNPKIPCNYT